MSANDPFAVVPFKLPEQFRVFAEMGVFQAQDSYQKLMQRALDAVFKTDELTKPLK